MMNMNQPDTPGLGPSENVMKGTMGRGGMNRQMYGNMNRRPRTGGGASMGVGQQLLGGGMGGPSMSGGSPMQQPRMGMGGPPPPAPMNNMGPMQQDDSGAGGGGMGNFARGAGSMAQGFMAPNQNYQIGGMTGGGVPGGIGPSGGMFNNMRQRLPGGIQY